MDLVLDDVTIEIPNTETCLICLEDVDYSKYAIVNHKNEDSFKYHIECLQEWFNKHVNRGVLRNIPVKSYSIYIDAEMIVTVPLRQRINSFMSMNIENSNIENNNSDTRRCCGLVCILIFIILIIFIGRNYI